jgi:osmotically-inducible protein OsmY
MYRCFSCLLRALCLGVCVLSSTALLFVFTVTASHANPGAMVEPIREQRGVTDPVVERVRAAIVREVPDTRYNIRIQNTSDYVLLDGEVDSQRSKERVVSAAGIAAAKRIRDELRIRQAPADDQVAASVRSALKSEYPGLASRVTVEVREGVAYFTGDLSNHREVDELLATTLMIDGVRDVRSDITLRGRPYAHQHLRVRRGRHY